MYEWDKRVYHIIFYSNQGTSDIILLLTAFSKADRRANLSKVAVGSAGDIQFGLNLF